MALTDTGRRQETTVVANQHFIAVGYSVIKKGGVEFNKIISTRGTEGLSTVESSR